MMDLKKPTTAERIWLWRRRQQNTTGRAKGRGGARMSVGEAAAMLNLPFTIYANAEGRIDDDIEAQQLVMSVIEESGGVLKFKPTEAELCALARRRSGAAVGDLCRALGGISAPTFYAKENAGDADLVDLWRARGYEF